MKNKIILFVTVIYINLLFAQTFPDPVSYPTLPIQTVSNMNIIRPENVLIVYNLNSTISVNIKEYYKNARNIPNTNVLGLNIRDTVSYNGERVILTQNGEVIRRDNTCANDGNNGVCDNLVWQYYMDIIAQPITNYLNNTINPSTGNYLKDMIHYIVLCKGIPLKLKAADQGWIIPWPSYHISIDGLLCLLKTNNNNNPSILQLYPIPPNYGYSCRVANPYYQADLNFNLDNRFKANNFFVNKVLNDNTEAQFKITCLISRLDGRSEQDVKDLIDRSVQPDLSGNGTWVLDGHNFFAYETPYYVGYNAYNQNTIGAAVSILSQLGFNVFTDGTSRTHIYSHDEKVAGYLSWGRHAGNPIGFITDELDFNLMNGAVYNTIESYNANSMDPIYRTNEQSIVSEFIQIDGTFGLGHTYEPLLGPNNNPLFAFPAYAMGYNVVEAAYQGIQYLAWQNLVIGDPLTTIAWGKQTLSENTTWNGANLVTGKITIPSGKTLTITGSSIINIKHQGALEVQSGGQLIIQPGAVLKFYNGSKLYVSGTGNLQANGTAGGRIVFDFISRNSSTQNGIHLSTGTASIKYCDIKNAYRGIYIINTNPVTIQNCNILYNTFGIYQAYGNSSSSIIDQNNISYNYSDGIYIQESIPPQITKNTISYNGRHGIYITSYTSARIYNVNKIEYNNGDGIKSELCSVYLLPTSGTGNNILRANFGNASLHAVYSGNVYANNSYSSIYWGEYLHAYAESNGHIYAENNWWGSAPPYGFATNGGTIDYTPYLYSDPNAGLGKTSGDVYENASKILYPSDSFFDSELKNILAKMIEGKYEEAISLYQQRLKIETNKEKKRYILQSMAECYQLTDKKDFKTLLDRDVRTSLLRNDDLYASTLELENLFLVKDEKYDKAINNLNILKKDFSNNEAIDKYANFNLWSLYFQKINDQTKAETYYNELREKYPDDDLTITAMLLTGERDSITRPSLLKKELTVKKIPKEFALLGNYPNPFNPTTTISYILPYESDVELKIYDIMGREVKLFNINSQTSGNQSISWDGTNENGNQVSSGIYIYRITLKSLESNEVFTKTAKLIMLK